MTGAGMFGTVVGVDGDQVTLETAPGSHLDLAPPGGRRGSSPRAAPDPQDAQAAAAETGDRADQDRSASSDVSRMDGTTGPATDRTDEAADRTKAGRIDEEDN